MKRLGSILFLLLAVWIGFAPTLSSQRKKVGVVLSGGGAKGVAHIGVLKVLEEAGIPIDYITGTSMGAIVGGLYAIGYTPDMLDSLVRKQDWIALLSDKVDRSNQLFSRREQSDRYVLSFPLSKESKQEALSGAVSGQNVYNLLSELTVGFHGSIDFLKLPTPFSCVAYDISTGKEVVQSSGNLPMAIRASMSFPGAFRPVKRDSMVLIDGGVINNFPVDVARSMGADIIIGVDVGSGLRTAQEVNSVFGIVDQFASIIGNPSYEKNKAATDLYLQPDVEPYSAASFGSDAISILLNRGEQAARLKYDSLLELRRKLGKVEPRVVVANNNRLDQDSVELSKLKIQGLNPKNLKVATKVLNLPDSGRVAISQLTHSLSELRGTGAFSDVSFQLGGADGEELTVFLKPRAATIFNMGVRFDSQEMAGLLLGVDYMPNPMTGFSLELLGRLSSNPYGKVTANFGKTMFGKMGFSYLYYYSDVNLYERGNKQFNAEYNQHCVDLRLSEISLKNFKFNFGVQYDYYKFNSFLYTGYEEEIDVNTGGFLNLFALAHLETLDNSYYPKRGYSLKGSYMMINELRGYTEFNPLHALGLSFRWAHSLGRRVTLENSIYARALLGDNLSYPYLNLFGGDHIGRYAAQQIPFIGVQRPELANNLFGVLRLDLRVELWKGHYLSAIGNYGYQADGLDEVLNGEHLYGVGVKYAYDTFLGPVSLLIDYSNRTSKVGAYISLGRFF